MKLKLPVNMLTVRSDANRCKRSSALVTKALSCKGYCSYASRNNGLESFLP